MKNVLLLFSWLPTRDTSLIGHPWMTDEIYLYCNSFNTPPWSYSMLSYVWKTNYLSHVHQLHVYTHARSTLILSLFSGFSKKQEFARKEGRVSCPFWHATINTPVVFAFIYKLFLFFCFFFITDLIDWATTHWAVLCGARGLWTMCTHKSRCHVETISRDNGGEGKGRCTY